MALLKGSDPIETNTSEGSKLISKITNVLLLSQQIKSKTIELRNALFENDSSENDILFEDTPPEAQQVSTIGGLFPFIFKTLEEIQIVQGKNIDMLNILNNRCSH